MSMPDAFETDLITTPAALRSACDRMAAAGSFGFDTEFVGEDSYNAEICLIQAATDSYCAVIDPLADLDATPIWDLVVDEAVQVIVHAGAEDLAHCWKQNNKPAANVFDLQVAAGLIGRGYPTSLTRLARVTIGARLHKSQTLTDWRKRPLSDEQIHYAAEDVVHLPAMYRAIHEALVRAGRDEWAIEECARLCAAATQTARGENKLRRLRGAGSLKRSELAIADALLDERDKLASEYDRPPRSVLRDHLLVEIARRGWTDVQRIRSLRGMNLSAAALRRLVSAIEIARKLPEDQWPELPTEEDSKDEEVLLSLMSAVLRDYCRRDSLSYALLTSKQELRALVRTYTRDQQPEQPMLLKSGWREAAVGELLDNVLSGRCAVRVQREGDATRLAIE